MEKRQYTIESNQYTLNGPIMKFNGMTFDNREDAILNSKSVVPFPVCRVDINGEWVYYHKGEQRTFNELFIKG